MNRLYRPKNTYLCTFRNSTNSPKRIKKKIKRSSNNSNQKFNNRIYPIVNIGIMIPYPRRIIRRKIPKTSATRKNQKSTTRIKHITLTIYLISIYETTRASRKRTKSISRKSRRTTKKTIQISCRRYNTTIRMRSRRNTRHSCHRHEPLQIILNRIKRRCY